MVTLDDVRNKKQTGEKETKKIKDQIDNPKLSQTESKKPKKQTKQQIKEMNKQNNQAFKQTWTNLVSSGEEEVGQDILDNFKKFTV